MISVIKWRNCQQEFSFPKTTVPDFWEEKFDVLSLISLSIQVLVSGIQQSDSGTRDTMICLFKAAPMSVF